VAFAAARMAFYALMKTLEIAVGDEVILPGATCAVMVNAVLRVGATPVYADIDPETFGSSAVGIEACITSKTRMIVAQHSFGIPCNIEPIISLAKARGIFLLEDCALTLGSKLGGVTVGNFGDAALFSTDHSKPLNTMTGGLVITKDAALATRLRKIQSAAAPLPAAKQLALWNRVVFERQFCMPARYGSVALRDAIRGVTALSAKRPFLDEDFGTKPANGYPYPARMPTFLAAIGNVELKHWRQTAARRKDLLCGLLGAIETTRAARHIPAIYRDGRAEIVPLRLAWAQENSATIRTALSHFIDVEWTWFMEPIVGVQTALKDYSYRPGSCPHSERLGPNMLNIPCNIPAMSSNCLMEKIRMTLSS
jgi:dTDP-4-amino-4,6-dideoxygalactose transaminase